RDTAVPASSLDFLQGTSEKIHLHGFVRQYSFQFVDFLAKCGFPGIAYRGLALSLTVSWVQPMPPLVQQAAIQTEFSSQSQDIVTTVHSLHSSYTELLGISLMPFSFHFAAPFLQSVFRKSLEIHGIGSTHLQTYIVNMFPRQLDFPPARG